jgi:hypothetical protein
VIHLLIVLLAAQDLPVEQTKKNIKVLTGLPSSQLIPVMAFMSNSLGVTCGHCHVGKTWEVDDKPAKETARAHLKMTRAINEQNFGGRVVVTCNSCHQGHVTPAATPRLADAGWNHAAPAPSALPEPAAVLARYRPAAMPQTVHGKVERYNGREEPVSGMFTVDEGRFATELSYPPEANRALRAPQFDAYSNWTTVAIENGAVVLSATPKEGPPERFWLDAKSGALLRWQRLVHTPLGDLPEEMEYGRGLRRWSRADYRVTFTFDDASGGTARQ